MSDLEGRAPALPDDLLASLAASARSTDQPPAEVVAALRATLPDLEALAAEPPEGHPYSRQILHSHPDVEIMVARWGHGAVCAPHDHGGSSGFVTVISGDLEEYRHAWDGADLVVTEQIERRPGDVYGFGPEVVHSMGAGPAGGVTLHVYAPGPTRMSVYDLDRRLVLDLVGDFGAWVPEGDLPGVPFAEAAAMEASAATAPMATPPDVIWVGHTLHYRGGSAEFAIAAETMRRELAAANPDLEVQLAALDGKDDFTAEMDRLAAEGRQIRELHFVGHAGMYGPMFKSTEWPEQFSPHEWRTMSIPFAPGASAWFHCCRTARWFAPFFARTFDVPTWGNQNYTTVSTSPDRFAWAGRHPERQPSLYLVATVGKKTHGIAGSLRKYAGAPVEPLIECRPAPPDGITSYDKVAELYDRAYVDITVREAEWAWMEAHLATARSVLGRPLRILEIGCGNGALLRELDDRGELESGIGLDDSIGMVDAARARSADHPRLRFDRIDGPVVDAPDASVDVVLSFLSFRYLDWDPIMDEVRRVLVPGGRLWVVDMVEKPVQVRDLPLLVQSTVHHLQMPKKRPEFARDLAALTSHPDWKTMLRHNPIRAEHEYRWFLESRFPAGRLEVLNTTRTQRVVAFDSGPIAPGTNRPLSFP